MDLDDFIIGVFCLVDDAVTACLQGRRLRQRGPRPTLADSEVLTMEVVGEYLGLDRETALFAYFRRHYGHFFPALRRVHRTTFTRQAANLWRLKERVWQWVLARAPHDPGVALIDSFPLPACQFARAPRCRRFRGEAAFGRDVVARQTMYGFRIHARVCWPGVITRFSVAPANASDVALVEEVTAGTTGLLIGDRNSWSPTLTAALAERDLRLLAPYRSAKRDPHPASSAALSPLRYRIDTVFGQLVDRYHIKRVWARDTWHLASRLLRKVLSHTIAFALNHHAGNHPLQLAELVA